MRTLKIMSMSLLIVVLGFAFISMTIQQQKKAEPWEVGARYKSMENTVASDDASVKTGKGMYSKFCASCHGKTGLGDGVKARGLKTFPGDFTGAGFQDQTDGEIFFKTKAGRAEMPKFEGKVQDKDIWSMVNYMRTLKK